jgi:hypothetical protein
MFSKLLVAVEIFWIFQLCDENFNREEGERIQLKINL